MSDADLIKLYSGQILDLAASIPLQGRLAAPGSSQRKRSPICGSTITVDLTLDQGKVVDFAQEVRACALGQASAAILGRVVLGRSGEELHRARAELQTMLKEGGPPPMPPFELYRVLEPARDYRNRHASILLALEATCAAYDAACAGDPAP